MISFLSQNHMSFFFLLAGRTQKTDTGDGKPTYFKSGPNLITPKGAD